ncbi:hypothetical protein Tco_0666908 [Tanacetum coccineum]
MVPEPVVELRRNTRRQVRSKPVVEEFSEIGLDDKLGETVVEDGVAKRNLRGRGKKGVDTKNVVESASSKRVLRGSKKARKVTGVPELSKIPEETTDVVVAVEPKNTRGRKKKLLPLDVSEGTGLDEQKLAEVVPIVGRRTRGGRMAVAVEPLKNVKSGGIEENVNDGNESIRVDEGNEANNEPAQDQVIEKLVLMEEGRDGMESVAGGSSVKGSSKVADVDKGKKVAEELESTPDGAEGSMKKTEPDSRKWDLEKMTLGAFFDYIEFKMAVYTSAEFSYQLAYVFVYFTDRPQMLQRLSATNVNVPQLETFDTARCIGTGSGGLKNLADDVGGPKRQSISEPDSVLRRESALRIGQTSAAVGKYVFCS